MESAQILFDKNITGIECRIKELASARSFDGRTIDASDLEYCEVLIVRSVTKVDRNLLDDSRVKLVCSATAGLDHVDVDYLKKSGIDFFSTQGCNSKAVMEYTVNCIFSYAASRGISPFVLTVGIVGYGNVGKQLAMILGHLGIKTLINDPPLQERDGGSSTFSTIQEILDCDVVTLHVPYSEVGEFPTKDLFDEEKLKRLRTSVLIINTARGGVINELDLLKVIKERDDLYVALDCWSGEPRINSRLAQVVWRASPHIAGSSLNSRERAVSALVRKLTEYFGFTNGVLENSDIFAPQPKPVVLQDPENLINLFEIVMPLGDITSEMRHLEADSSGVSLGRLFDELRKKYSDRKDFCFYQVETSSIKEELISKLGFGKRT